MNAAKLTTQRVSRINSLLNRMLSNAERSESCSSRSDSIDRIGQSTPKSDKAPRPTINANLKRNLFGVSLNHDQLKQDLHSMWKEQIQVQNVKWNFDFETLKPIESGSDRFKWTECQVVDNTNSKYTSTLLNETDNLNLDKENINSNKSNDIPQFYKQQRSLKLIDNIAPIIKKQDNDELIKPKPIKTTKAAKSLGLSQIITFSENRKDTLRSASSSNKVTKSSNSAFTAKQENNKTDNLKQQSLLDMFKQRKKRIQTASTTKDTSKETNKDKSAPKSSQSNKA